MDLRCGQCGADNAIANECGCDPRNLPTRATRACETCIRALCCDVGSECLRGPLGEIYPYRCWAPGSLTDAKLHLYTRHINGEAQVHINGEAQVLATDDAPTAHAKLRDGAEQCGYLVDRLHHKASAWGCRLHTRDGCYAISWSRRGLHRVARIEQTDPLRLTVLWSHI